MSNIRLFALAVLLLIPGLSFANQAASGFCTTGGIKVTTVGTTSTNPVQASYPGCSVSVSVHGGGLATITDANGGALANPFTASSTNGFWQFAAANGFYDVTLSGGTPALPSPVTIVNLLLNDPGTAAITASSFTGSSFISSTALVAGSGIFRCASIDNCLNFRNNGNTLDLVFKKTGAAAGNLPADVLDASAFGGIKVSQFFSNSAQSAATGVLACSASDTCVSFRNQANSADIPGVAKDASDRVIIGGAAGFTASIGNITNGLTIGTTLTVGGASSLQGVTATTITASGEIAPSITGGALGDTAHRFDAFIRNLDVSGTTTGLIAGSGTVNTIPKFTGTNTINNSSITDNGVTVSTPENTSVGGTLAATGAITTKSSVTMQTASGTLPATIANDTTGGIVFTTNGSKAWAIQNSGNLLGSGGAALVLIGGTSGFAAINPPNVAGSTQVTLPVTAGDILVGNSTAATLTGKILTGTSTGNSIELLSTCFPQGPTASINGTGASVSIFTCSLLANTVESGKILHVICSGIHDTGTTNVNLALTLNGQSVTSGSTGTVASQSFSMEAYILRTGVTTAQTWGITPNSTGVMTPFSIALTGLAFTSNQTLDCEFNVAAGDHITGRVWAPMSVQ